MGGIYEVRRLDGLRSCAIHTLDKGHVSLTRGCYLRAVTTRVQLQKDKVWGIYVPRINVENVIKFGCVLE
jgi:hypothetical protein